jgi:hypothetical protein
MIGKRRDSKVPGTSAMACSCLIFLTSAIASCATVDCEREAKEAAPPNDDVAFTDARAKCEDRLDGARRKLKKDQEEREAAERRDAFRNRNDGRRR